MVIYIYLGYLVQYDRTSTLGDSEGGDCRWPVDYGSGVPLDEDDARLPYVQVAEDLRAQIAAGTWRPGDRLPAGRDLAEQYGVALMTVQKAISSLRDDGLLVAQQGRGTFVASGNPATRSSSPEFTEITRQIGDLRDLVEQTAQRLDERLTALEKAAGVKPAPRSRPRRG